MSSRTLVCLAAALAITACNPTQLPDPEPQPVGGALATQPAPLGRVDAPPDSPHHLPFGAPERKEAFREMVAAAGPVQAAADALLKQNLPLPDTHREMQAVFEQDLPRDARWLLQTTFGMRMLRLLLADPESDPGAIAFYTERLAAYRNPNADVLFAALDRIGDRWSAEQQRSARSEIEAGALDWLQRTACESCRTRAALRDMYPEGQGLDARNRAILDALAG